MQDHRSTLWWRSDCRGKSHVLNATAVR
jgi:hypothetical protein